MICMKSLRFSSHSKAKVRCLGPQGSARAQPRSGVCMKRLSVKRAFGLPVIAEVDPSSTVKPPDLEPEF